MIDRSGLVFGFWKILSFAGKDKNNQKLWLCQCVCGKEKVVIFNSLQKGRSKSCGCKSTEMRVKKQTKHGMAGTPTYKSWHQMHQRCLGKNGKDYYVKNHITVCERWNSFQSFFEDMGERPKGTTIDRIDGSKGYEPGNCRWADNETQGNNKKSNKHEFVFGEKMTPAQAARKFDCHISGLRHRLRKGMTIEESVSKPFIPKPRKNKCQT